MRRTFRVGEWIAVYERARGHCGICEGIVEPGTEAIDHIVSIARGGEDRPENCQLAHRRCNAQKHARLQEELLDWQLETDPEDAELRAILSARKRPRPEAPPRQPEPHVLTRMTVAQAAAALGITARAVRYRIDQGDLRAEHVSTRLLLIPTAEVERAKAEPIRRGPRRSAEAR